MNQSQTEPKPETELTTPSKAGVGSDTLLAAALAAVDAQEELDGPMPEDLYNVVVTHSREEMAGFLRSIVRITKDGIRRRIQDAANVSDQATASAGHGKHDRQPTSGCLHPFCSPLVLVVVLMSFVALPCCYGIVPFLPFNDTLQNGIVEPRVSVIERVIKVGKPLSGGVLLCPLVATDSVGNEMTAAGNDNSGQRDTAAKQIAATVPVQSDAAEGNQDASPSRDVLQGFQSMFSRDRPVYSVINFVAVTSVVAHLLYGIAWILTIPVRRSLKANDRSPDTGEKKL